MIYNYGKIAWRKIIDQPGHSFLNIFGLALGIAASFVLLLFVRQETSYDQHFSRSNKIYRIASDFFNMGGFACTSTALYSWLKEDCKEAKYVTAIESTGDNILFTVESNEFLEEPGMSVDSNFFKVFSFDFKERTTGTAVLSPNEIILSEKLASKYFGEESALGRTILMGEEQLPYKVSGVLKQDRRKTHLETNFFIPLEINIEPNWTSASVFVYVMLHDESGPDQLQQSLETLRRDIIYPPFSGSQSYDEWKTSNYRVDFFPQPVEEIYLHSKYQFDFSARGNAQQVAILGLIGLFLIILAIINYVNLTTARSSMRAKEVGVKKTLGATRGTLSLQFMFESVFTSALAMIMAGALAELLLVVFREITGQFILDSLLSDWRHAGMLALFSLMVGLLSGIYPAFYLTRFKPIRVLKGMVSLSGNSLFRSGLVIFQFAVAAGLIMGSLIVYQQMKFLQKSDKGFDQEGVLIVTNMSELKNQSEAFRQELLQFPQVKLTSFNDRMPAESTIWMSTYRTPEMEEAITIQTFPVDENYIPAIGFRLREGRNFRRDAPTDSSAIIMNQAAIGALGLQGKNLSETLINDNLRVVGVVENFNFQSLRETISPIVMKFGPRGHRLAVKLRGSNISNFIQDLEKTWSRFSPEEPINYTFLDENFANLAAKEKMLSQAITIFTVMAILIACMGLLGLAAFTIQLRRKEIGVRIILGATIAGVVNLLSRDFLKLVIIALLLASPLAYYWAGQWLQDFAYHVNIQWWIFLLTAALLITGTVLIVSFQGLRAALKNPIDALRNE